MRALIDMDCISVSTKDKDDDSSEPESSGKNVVGKLIIALAQARPTLPKLPR